MTPEEIEEIRRIRKNDAVEAIKTRTTVMQRWATTDLEEKARVIMDERSQAVARLITPRSRILDVGCLDMKLESHLPAGCTYIPLDVIKRDERTLVVDLNHEPLPKVEVDLIVVMGVLEYLHDLPAFFRQTAQTATKAIFSYYPLEQSPTKDRLAVGWVNALNSPELLALLRYAGYGQIDIIPYKPALHFYHATALREKAEAL